jgi:CBS domain-containing protein
MLLKEFCTTDPLCCSRNTTVIEAARIMRQKHVGDLVVADDVAGECLPVGLITDRDIVVNVLADELDPRQTKVDRIMGMPLVTADETEDAASAITRMRAHGVRRLPVTGKDGRLAGIVTLDDLLRAVARDLNALVDIVDKGQDLERRTNR